MQLLELLARSAQALHSSAPAILTDPVAQVVHSAPSQYCPGSQEHAREPGREEEREPEEEGHGRQDPIFFGL